MSQAPSESCSPAATTPRDLLREWDKARAAHLEKAFEGAGEATELRPMLAVMIKESFDAGFVAAIEITNPTTPKEPK